MKRRHFFKIAGAAATAVVVPLPALAQQKLAPAPTLEPTREPTPGQFYEIGRKPPRLSEVAKSVLMPCVVYSVWINDRLHFTVHNPNDVPVDFAMGMNVGCSKAPPLWARTEAEQ